MYIHIYIYIYIYMWGPHVRLALHIGSLRGEAITYRFLMWEGHYIQILYVGRLGRPGELGPESPGRGGPSWEIKAGSGPGQSSGLAMAMALKI